MTDAPRPNEQIRYVQLETGTACNYKCVYCPVAHYPRKGGLMSLPMFARILDQLKNFPNVERIYLNGYDEPTLNPHLATIVGMLAHKGARIVLFTNGTHLTPELINNLAATHADIELDVHLSATNPRDFERIHQSKLFNRVLENLHYLKTHKHLERISVQISMQGRDNPVDDTIFSDMRSYFAEFPFPVYKWVPNDRAGLLGNEYSLHISQRLLRGCRLQNRTQDWLHITATGKVILCCQDYHEKYILGDVNKHTLMDIVASDVRARYHRWTTGQNEAPDDYICRRCVFAVSDHPVDRALLSRLGVEEP
jgi:radical SAM protein with 4Fe4S-binding SPASM domain